MSKKTKPVRSADTVTARIEPASPSKILRALDHLTQKGLYAILLFVPIAILPNVYWPFEVPKVTLLRILTLFVMAAWLSRGLIARELKLVRPAVLWPVVAYLAVYAVATLFSISHDLSLYGGGGRTLGLLSLANIVLLYFLVFQVMTTRGQLMRCVQLLLASGLIAAVTGIYQYYAQPTPGSVLMILVPGRASSTFGNPDFLLAFVIPVIALAGAFLLSKKWRYFPALFLLMFGAILALPPLFGVIPDLLIGCAVLALLTASAFGARRGWLWACVPLLVVVVFGVGTVAASEKASDYLERHVGGKDSRRSELVRTALQSVPDYPILGSGPNTFRDTYPRYRSLSDTQSRPDQGEDKVHNSFVEALATTGIVGLLAYVTLLASFGWAFVRWLRRNRGHPDVPFVAMILLGGILYVGQSILNFHTTVPYTFFWLLMAIGLALAQVDNPSVRTLTLGARKAVSAVAVVACLAVLGWLVVLSVRPLVADFHFNRAHDLLVSDPSRTSDAVPDYERAIDFNGAEAKYLSEYITTLDVVRRNARVTGDPSGEPYACRQMLWASDRLIDNGPKNGFFYWNRAEIRVECEEPDVSLGVMKEDATTALKWYPYSFRAWRLMGRVEVMAKDFQAAINAFRASLEIEPNQPETHFALGFIYEETGALEDARHQYVAALELDPNLAEAQEGLDRLQE